MQHHPASRICHSSLVTRHSPFCILHSAFCIIALAAFAASAAPVFVPDDEPDSLSWERFSQDRTILLHFLDWAATNPPPPGSTGILPAADARERVPPAARFPFVWVKAAQEPFTATNLWRVDSWRNEECLYCTCYSTHPRTYQTIEVPEDGVYRFWIRQAHTKGTSESNFFRMTPAFDGENNESGENSALFAVFQQTFARANTFRGTIWYTRPRDPAPEINGQPHPALPPEPPPHRAAALPEHRPLDRHRLRRRQGRPAYRHPLVRRSLPYLGHRRGRLNRER